MKSKIVFVVQRYGTEINGGAELHCKLLAQHLKDDYEVEVLTSCALSYVDWLDHYPSGETTVDGIKVLRFPTNNFKTKQSYWLVRKKNRIRKILILLIKTFMLHKLPLGKRIIHYLRQTIFNTFIKSQGPYLPSLIDYLKTNSSNYQAIIFFTYLYYPTVKGIHIAPKKSILIPTAHDEPAIKNPNFKNVFTSPAAIIYNTKEEKDFVNNLFDNSHIRSSVAGIGVEIDKEAPYINIPELYGFSGEYILYLGRIDSHKGCKILIDYFNKFKAQTNSELKLLMLGSHFMTLYEHPDIFYPGFADEVIKVNAIKQSLSLIVPSFYESLSMVTLEAMYLKVPVIVNGECEVLKSHIIKSDGGFYYTNYEQFKDALNILMGNQDLRKTKGMLGAKYVEENYNWEVILDKIKKEINRL